MNYLKKTALGASLILILIYMVFLAINNDNIVYAEELFSTQYTADVKKDTKTDVVCKFEKEINDVGEDICLKCQFNEAIENYNTVTTEGIKIIRQAKERNSVFLTLFLEDDLIDGKISILQNYKSGNNILNIYFFVTEKKIFHSTISEDDAWRIGLDYKVKRGLISQRESEKEYANLSHKNLIEEFGEDSNIGNKTKGARSATTYLQGTIQWTTPLGYVLPMKQIRVDLYDDDPGLSEEHIATTYTDNNGHYSFAFENDESTLENGGLDIFIRCYPDSDTFAIAREWLFNNYTYYKLDSNVLHDICTAHTYYLNITTAYTTDNNDVNAFRISQALVTAQRFYEMLTCDHPTRVIRVCFPFTNDEGSFCLQYDGLYLMGISQSSMDDWDVIMHEYGHYVEHMVGNYDISLLQFMIYGPHHSFTQDLIVEKQNKYYGSCLAWTEAWADAFSLLAQKRFHSEYLYETPEGTFEETLVSFGDDSFYMTYIDNNTLQQCEVDFENLIENQTTYPYIVHFSNNCEGCEGSIVAILLDLFDDTNELDDYIHMGYQEWWDVTTQDWNTTHVYNFSDFVNAFYSYYSESNQEYVHLLGYNLEHYNMAPISSFPHLVNADISPYSNERVFVITNAEGGNAPYKNNEFKLVIYSEDWSCVYNGPVMDVSSINIDETYFNGIKNFPGGIVHVGVAGRQTSYPTTGFYISHFVDYNKRMFITTPENRDTIIGMYSHYLDTIQLVIPEKIDGFTITKIGANAFKNAPYAAITFEKQENIVSIGASAFENSHLGFFGVPENVSTIESYTFKGLSNPIIEYWGNNVTTIGEGAFYGSPMTLETTIPASVVTIGKDAFKNAGFPNSFSLEANNSLTTIGESAFFNTNLKTINLSSNVTSIGQKAFGDCPNLTIYTTYDYATNGPLPSGWDSNWNSSGRPVVWNCTLSSDNSYVTSFERKANNIQNYSAGIGDPYLEGYNFNGWNTSSSGNGTSYTSANLASVPIGTTVYAQWKKKSCVAEGTLITLADGTQVAVENLTGNENLLVWNMLTGQYDSAPILFIDSDPSMAYEVIELTFSDGTAVKVIDEHAFFDMTLGEYVFLRSDAAQYIGHYFNKQGPNGTWVTVQLTDVDVYTEVTTAWSPVTYGHLCYYVNGMLSMPGATEGFINIFEVDTALMKYDEDAMEEDILTYGLFTYEDFNAIIPIPELVFDAFCGQYLKVSIGKGLITLADIATLLDRYNVFFN